MTWEHQSVHSVRNLHTMANFKIDPNNLMLEFCRVENFWNLIFTMVYLVGKSYKIGILTYTITEHIESQWSA